VSRVSLYLIFTFIFLASNAQYVSRFGMTSDEYQAEFDKYVGQEGMRLSDVSGYNRYGEIRYAAIWVTDTSGPDWVARHGLSAADYQSAVTEFTGQGYRPHRISVFENNNNLYFACIFHKTSSPWEARHDLASDQYQSEFTSWTNQGYRPIEVSGYTIGDSIRYAAVWEKSSGAAWIARHDMTSDGYQSEFDTNKANGYMPVRVGGFEVGGTDYYAAIWNNPSDITLGRHRLSESELQTELDNADAQGRELKQLVGYGAGGEPRFAALWTD